MNRRDFIKNAGLISAGALLLPEHLYADRRRSISKKVGITYATWSAANSATHITISGGGLTVTSSSGTATAFTNLYVANGTRRYWEVKSNSNNAGTLRVGVGNSLAVTLNSSIGAVASQWALESLSNPGGQVVNNGTSFSNGYASQTFNSGDIIGIALDLVANTIQF